MWNSNSVIAWVLTRAGIDAGEYPAARGRSRARLACRCGRRRTAMVPRQSRPIHVARSASLPSASAKVHHAGAYSSLIR